MKKIYLILILIMLHADPAKGCMVPYSGPEFDQLVQVSEIDGKNRFKVVLPRRLGDLQVRYVGLQYLIIDDNLNAEYPNVSDFHEMLFHYTYYDLFFDWITFHSRTQLEIEFEVEYIEGHIPVIHASWWPWSCCPCSADGYSQHLKVVP